MPLKSESDGYHLFFSKLELEELLRKGRLETLMSNGSKSSGLRTVITATANSGLGGVELIKDPRGNGYPEISIKVDSFVLQQICLGQTIETFYDESKVRIRIYP